MANRPRSIDQYSNMDPRLSGETSIFGGVFYASKSLLGITRQNKNLKNFQCWYIERDLLLERKTRHNVKTKTNRAIKELSICFSKFSCPSPKLLQFKVLNQNLPLMTATDMSFFPVTNPRDETNLKDEISTWIVLNPINNGWNKTTSYRLKRE